MSDKPSWQLPAEELAGRYRKRMLAAEARVKELEANYAEIASALGVEYAAEGHGAVPGPIDAVLRSIRNIRDSSNMTIELEAKLAAIRAWLESDDCDGTEQLHWRITLEELVGT